MLFDNMATNWLHNWMKSLRGNFPESPILDMVNNLRGGGTPKPVGRPIFGQPPMPFGRPDIGGGIPDMGSLDLPRLLELLRSVGMGQSRNPNFLRRGRGRKGANIALDEFGAGSGGGGFGGGSSGGSNTHPVTGGEL